jgi:hypothetical protein
MDKLGVMTSVVKDARLDAPSVPLRTSWRPTTEAIAKRAYELYEESGRLDGRDVEFWLKAEKELYANR